MSWKEGVVALCECMQAGESVTVGQECECAGKKMLLSGTRSGAAVLYRSIWAGERGLQCCTNGCAAAKHKCDQMGGSRRPVTPQEKKWGKRLVTFADSFPIDLAFGKLTGNMANGRSLDCRTLQPS